MGDRLPSSWSICCHSSSLETGIQVTPPSLPSLLFQTLLVLRLLIFCPFSRKEHTDLSSHSYCCTFSYCCCWYINSCKCQLWCWLLMASPPHLRLYCPWADNLESPKILPFKQDSYYALIHGSQSLSAEVTCPVVLILWSLYQQLGLWSKGKISQDSKTSGFSCGVWIFFLNVANLLSSPFV